MASAVTGKPGAEAMQRFCKQLIIGSARDRGLVDTINDSMEVAWELPVVRLGRVSLLPAFSFAEQGPSGLAYEWALPGVDAAYLDSLRAVSVCLVGFSDDLHFYLVFRSELLSAALAAPGGGYFVRKPVGSPDLARWEEAWAKVPFSRLGLTP